MTTAEIHAKLLHNFAKKMEAVGWGAQHAADVFNKMNGTNVKIETIPPEEDQALWEVI